jgi:hypothetical protein
MENNVPNENTFSRVNIFGNSLTVLCRKLIERLNWLNGIHSGKHFLDGNSI